MSKMVERVARAIYAKRPDCLGKPWPIETDEQRRRYPHFPIAAVDLSYEYARAAIEAMREPNEAMVEAGQLYVWQDGEPTAGPHAVQRRVFVAMIDAALEEPAKAD